VNSCLIAVEEVVKCIGVGERRTTYKDGRLGRDGRGGGFGVCIGVNEDTVNDLDSQYVHSS
jgi:hypothetical protein